MTQASKESMLEVFIKKRKVPLKAVTFLNVKMYTRLIYIPLQEIRLHLSIPLARLMICVGLGLLGFLQPETQAETEGLLGEGQRGAWRRDLRSPIAWLLLFVGILQCVTGIASQALQGHAA